MMPPLRSSSGASGEGPPHAGEGEQALSDWRGLLNYVTGVGEWAQDLRRGDVGVLKVAATPLHIEGVFSKFLHRYRGTLSQRAGEGLGGKWSLKFWPCWNAARYTLAKCDR